MAKSGVQRAARRVLGQRRAERGAAVRLRVEQLHLVHAGALQPADQVGAELLAGAAEQRAGAIGKRADTRGAHRGVRLGA